MDHMTTTNEETTMSTTGTHARRYSSLRERIVGATCTAANPKHRSETVECPACHGVGERCANPTNTDPQAVEFVPCSLCRGNGEVTTRDIAEYDAHVREVMADEPVPYTLADPFLVPGADDLPPF